jgi:hypothetical protein
MAQAFEQIACVHLHRGYPKQAVRLLGATEALCPPAGPSRVPHVHKSYEAAVAAARQALGDEAFAAAWAEGRAMSMAESIAYALEEERPS